jgi:opacity protein-like surface antigen
MKNTKSIAAFIIALMALSSTSLFAQDDRLDELPFEEEDIVEQKSKPYFAVAGGFIYNFLFMDLTELNGKLAERGLGEFSGPLMMYGGEGFTGLPWVENLRIGIAGIGGSMITDEVALDANNTDVLTQAEYSVTYTMLAVDYGFVVTDGLAILPGVGLGFGTQELAFYNSTDITWSEFPIIGQAESHTGTQKIDQDMVLLKPHVGVEWAFTDIFMLRLNAGYNLNLATAEDWNYSENGTVTDMPEINANGFNLQVGLFIGLFNY